ncbi:MAG: nicotinate-nucleotide adenylyltransferase [Bacteroidota bacterium]
MRLGIFGGSFNPPHIGHLIVAERVRESVLLDRILFVPTAVPPHKGMVDLVDAQHRLAMVQLAIKDNPFFELCDCEVKRGGISYTIETIRELKAYYTGNEFYLIIGLDNFLGFHRWRDPEAILAEVVLIVMDRPGSNESPNSSPYVDRALFVEVPLIEISASMIREKVKSGESIRYMVPRDVEEYIYSQNLYR